MDNDDFKQEENSKIFDLGKEITTETAAEMAKNYAMAALAITGTTLGMPSLVSAALTIVGGITVSELIKIAFKGGTNYINTHLSKRQEIRAGASVIYAINKIEKNKKDNLQIRQDDFFESRVNYQSKAQEIFEGVITKSTIQYQEKKINFIANIFANAAFMDDTSVEELHHVLEIADRFTYREICILALITKNNKTNNLQEKIGLVFPTEYATEPRIASFLGAKWTIFPDFNRSRDFYFLHEELKRLNELNLIGDYFWSYQVDTNRLPDTLRKNESPHSVFLYDFSKSTNPFAFKMSELMSLDEVEENDFNDLNKFFVTPVEVTFKSEEENKGDASISKPDYLVNNP